MSKPAMWFNIFVLVSIHTIDMLLTETYVGEHWERETFLPMAWCIWTYGIYNSLWLSRLCVYTFILYVLINREQKHLGSLFVVINLIYVSAMTPWLFFLRILTFPDR